MLALAVEQFANCCLSDACCKMKLSQITLVEGPFHLQIKQGSSLDTRDPAKIVKAVPRRLERGFVGPESRESPAPFLSRRRSTKSNSANQRPDFFTTHQFGADTDPRQRDHLLLPFTQDLAPI
jgi:hypothetical protein